MTKTSLSGDETAILQVAEQLRALSNNGLHFTDDPYQIERFHHILSLSAELVGMVDQRPLEVLKNHFFDDIALRSPFVAVDTAVFNEQGDLLLIQRADDHCWALPGGASDVGETPAAGAVREVWEETGLHVAVTALLGIFDSRLCGSSGSRHLYHILFAGHVLGGAAKVTLETLDVGWFAAEKIPFTALSPGHEARIRCALRWQADRSLPVFFDAPDWQPT